MVADGRGRVSRRWVLVAGAVGVLGAGGLAAGLAGAVWRRRRERAANPFGDIVTLRTVAATGPRGAVNVVGDSLTYERLADLVDQLGAAGFGPVRADGRPGRQCVRRVAMADSGVEAVRSALAAAPAPRWWVVALGENDADDGIGPADAEAMVAAVLDACGPGPVLWVNLHGTGGAADRAGFNAAIDAVAVTRPDTFVADWATEAADRPDWFVGDGIHNTEAGALARNRFVVARLVEVADAAQ